MAQLKIEGDTYTVEDYKGDQVELYVGQTTDGTEE